MAYQCLEYEFDSSLKDRTFILLQYLFLHRLRLESSPLSFARFSRMMDALSGEVKLRPELGAIMQFAQNVKGMKWSENETHFKYVANKMVVRNKFSQDTSSQRKKTLLMCESCRDLVEIVFVNVLLRI